MFKHIAPKFSLLNRTSYSRQVDPRAESIMTRVDKVIRAHNKDLVLSMSFTSDLWTSAAGDPFISLSLHYIDSNWNMQVFL